MTDGAAGVRPGPGSAADDVTALRLRRLRLPALVQRHRLRHATAKKVQPPVRYYIHMHFI